MQGLRRLLPHMFSSRGQHWNVFSCKCEDNLLYELGGIQPDPRDFVIARKAAYAVPQSTSILPETSDSLCSLLILTLQHDGECIAAAGFDLHTCQD